ncbi:MAG: hypothetical protein H0W44_09315 [Gammaproteobacteria bacterium]|nr:hypothetical protein [Gammaproteobacteria bacterium]
MSKKKWLVVLVLAGIAIGAWLWLSKQHDPIDTPMAQGKTPADFPQTASAWFDAMDGGVVLSDEERKGRNTWLLWTGGNQEFWNYMSTHSFGSVDLLKILDSRKRGSRFAWYGMMNDPDMKQAIAPDEFGLWMDVPKDKLAADVDPTVYGYPSGIVGLRVYPNPDFDAKAKAKWDATRYYTDQTYYYDTKLVRPYQIGMSCAFCHVSFHPVHPPKDLEAPEWANLSNNIGAEYLWINRIFGYDLKPNNFVWQLFNTSPPGALDTSFIATDNINNPRTMNAIFNVGARLGTGHLEKQAGGALDLPDHKPEMLVPHILKDGSDSVGIIGALSRVYVNIGQFHQQWLKNHNAILGGKPQTPFEVTKAQKNSVYWQSTAERVGPLAAYFVKAAGPMYLKDAESGETFLSKDQTQLATGKQLFADNCAECHSSKQPTAARGSEAYKTDMRVIVAAPDFLDNNYLSTDERIAVSELKTNACSALSTNAMRGNVWDNFSSETYKTLPSVGQIEVQHPLTGEKRMFDMPAGGPGYTRVPSLVTAWATAPFFHNNALGLYNQDPSVTGRLAAYNDAMEKMLWPEKRKGMDSIYRTTEESWIRIHTNFVPAALRPLLKELTDDENHIVLGPIPKGTPVNLLASIDLNLKDQEKLKTTIQTLIKVKKGLKKIHKENLTGDAATEVLKELVDPLLAISKCPDFVTDRGHYYGAELADTDKKALIEFVKTF